MARPVIGEVLTANLTAGNNIAIEVPVPGNPREVLELRVKECTATFDVITISDSTTAGATVPVVAAASEDFTAGTFRLATVQTGVWFRSATTDTVEYYWALPA